MRRSSKASQLISQSGNDDIYKFRCMQYLNFVLDQLVNQGHKFKLYASHIESLLRSNLNDITIQDIEKIKRMLQEGDRQKVQSQETGEFINYDLIDRKKYTLPQTYYNLQQAPKEALINMYVQKESTLNEVQMIKNQNRIQKLYQSNYKMLDLMFQLPQDYQQLEQQIEKEIQKNIEEIEPEQHEFELGKLDSLQKEKAEKDQDIPEPQENILLQNQTNLNIQEFVFKPVEMEQSINQKIQQIHNLTIEQPQDVRIQQQIIEKSTSEKDQEKQKQKELQPIADISFVQIKKKKKQRKKPTAEIKQPVIAAQPNNPIQQNKVQNNEEKFIQNQEINQIDDQVKAGPQPPQKRKYIRKKPLQPRKSKPEKQKVQIQEEKPLQIRIQDEKPPEIRIQDEKHLEIRIQEEKPLEVQKVQNKNQPAMEQEQHQLRIIQNAPLILQQLSKQIQQSQIKQSILPVTKQKKAKKPRKPQTLTQSQKKQSKKPIKQLQIMLPYPECEAQVNQLKKQIQELNIKIQDQKIEFIQNQKQALTILNLVQNIEPEKKDNQVQEVIQIPAQIIKIPSQIIQSHQGNQNIQQPSHHEIEQQTNKDVQQSLQKQSLKDESKKQKGGSRQLLTKKQSNKSSSEEYKPAQDELQSISELQKIVNPLDGHYESQNKQKKGKRKYTKRKSNKLLQNNQKPLESNVNNPDQVLTPNQTQPKQTKFRLTQEQRERIRQEKQKIKQMRLIQKEEKQKLKELEKLQKGTLKIKKSQTSNKESKSSSKQRNNSISINESSSYLFIAASEERKQTSPAKKQIPIQKVQKKQSIAILSNKKVDNLKHSLEQSIGNNSTREDLRMSLQKSLISQELMLIQESEKEVERQNQQLVELVSIKPCCLIEDNENKIEVFHKEQGENLHGLKRYKSQQEEVEKKIYEQGPKKKIKKTFQQTQKGKDLSCDIIPSESKKQNHPIQKFEGTQIIEQLSTLSPKENKKNNLLSKISLKDSQIEKNKPINKNKNFKQLPEEND